MYHKFSFQLSRGNSFTYKDGDPFRILLYNNGISTRFVVSPQLSWILDGGMCQKCHPSEKTIEEKSVIPGLTVSSFISTSEYKSTSLLTFGLGPTRLISPTNTFHN